jgi:hypothetical protein
LYGLAGVKNLEEACPLKLSIIDLKKPERNAKLSEENDEGQNQKRRISQ